MEQSKEIKKKCSNCDYNYGGTCLCSLSEKCNKSVLLFSKPCDHWKPKEK